ncbi:MAG: GGDEF domain-containing phosphodiesterase [Clostridia bacterium]
MRKLSKLLIPFLLVFSILIGGFTVRLIINIRSYGTLINYLGIVRGATQRLVKLELNDMPNDEMRAYLDGIVLELCTGSGKYGLVYPDNEEYREKLSQISFQWDRLKFEIDNVRSGANYKLLIELSEDYFQLANETVFIADNYANQQVQEATWLILAIVVICIFTWLGIFIYSIRRVNRLELNNRKLIDIAYIDKLTNAPNLEKFKIDAQALLLRYKNLKFAVLYADFENFKMLNDVFGHVYGNRLLQKYAEILRMDLGKFDTFCRVSADNFLILRAYEKKDFLLEQQKAVDLQLFNFARASANEQSFIRTCCGFCCLEDAASESQISNLIERANFARKTAKNNSLQKYIFYNESLRQKMLSEQHIENHMHTALECGEFKVYFQPKVSLETGKIASAEALTRWLTEDGLFISPSEFIPIFERTMFIVQLDQYVLNQVCRLMHERLDQGLPVVPISINVSLMQLYDPAFVKTYVKIKQDYSIPDYLLQVEFTESVVFENMDLLFRIIKDLKRYGFHCSLDDFGKGYSSLNLLKSLPVDELKLDALFFDETEDRDRARTVVSCVVDLAKRLNLQIVAEGVESESQVAFLRQIGCHLVQGFVFYHPMPSSNFWDLLELAPV